MSDQPKSSAPLLPWILAAAGLLLYLVTLNHWVTLASLKPTAQMLGWSWWASNLDGPLNYLLSLPVGLLPAAARPMALNVISALLAASTLAILVRTVSILPQDRTREQRQRGLDEFGRIQAGYYWLPPLFAALVLMFQHSFWEHAIAYTGESLNVFLFAYTIRCLLEFRLDARDRWLFRAVAAASLAVANAGLMVGFAPLLVASLIWIKRGAFFKSEFLLTSIAIALAGLALILLLPLVTFVSGKTDVGFWKLVWLHLTTQKSMLLGFPRYIVVILSLTSVFPVLCLSIRWPTSVGDVSFIGAIVTSLMFHVVHLMFLGICLWVFFDPRFSPRELGAGLPWLPMYYLSAISVGYFSGYVLTVFIVPKEDRKWKRPSAISRVIGMVLVGAVCLSFVAVPLMLAVRNLPHIQATNSPEFHASIDTMVSQLPDEGAVILSDRAELLVLVQGALQARGKANAHVLVSTGNLGQSGYHRQLFNRYFERWPQTFVGDDTPDPIPSLASANLVVFLALRNPTFYLHPSIGQSYFEYLQLDPFGLLYKVMPRPGNRMTDAPLTEEAINLNETFWKDQGTVLAKLALAETSAPDQPQSEAMFAKSTYSRALDFWGCALQRDGRLEEAARAFESARKANPDNLPAALNLEVNQELQTSGSVTTDREEKIKAINDRYRRWGAIYQEAGPIEEPSICHELGVTLTGYRQFRQGIIQIERARALQPTNVLFQVSLADVYLKSLVPQESLRLLTDLKAKTPLDKLPPEVQWKAISMEALSLYSLTNFAAAEQLLLTAQEKYPRAFILQQTLSDIYINSGHLTNAIVSLESQLKADSDNRGALLNLGGLYMRQDRWEDALKLFNRLLNLEPENIGALFNRSTVLLKLQRGEEAKRDLELIIENAPNYALARQRLGELYFQNGMIKDAAVQFDAARNLLDPDSPEGKQVRARLEEIAKSRQK